MELRGFVLVQLTMGTMGRKSWATEEQHAMLMGHFDAFLEARENNTIAKFFEDVFVEFRQKFPLPEPTAKEFNTAAGTNALQKLAVAKAEVQKFWKNMS